MSDYQKVRLMKIKFRDILSKQKTEYIGELPWESFSPNQSIIILDDDPTGCQTVSNVPLFFNWEKRGIAEALKKEVPLFFILTNSRSLDENGAAELLSDVLSNIKDAEMECQRKCLVISRSDSTLRGHYPLEPSMIADHLELKNPVQCLIPAFFQGGRFTIDDVHYVKEGEYLIPASETQFAKDASFGFSESDLKKYVEEKTNGSIKHNEVLSFSIDDLRSGGPGYVYEKLIHSREKVCIVNAISQKDMDVFALASRRAINEGKNIVFRIAASFINSFAGLPVADLLKPGDLIDQNNHGILYIVGSYVKKSSDQLQHLLENNKLVKFELDVEKLIQGDVLEVFSENISKEIERGRDCVLFTARRLITGHTATENLNIGSKVSGFISETVNRLSVPPSVIITKGGITSHVVARDGMEIKDAMVVGQILPGVPVIKPNQGKFENTAQVIFPGNVGETNALTLIYEKLKGNYNE